MSMSKRKLRQGVSHVLAVILVLACTILGITLGIHYGAMNKQVIMSQVQESNYYTEVHNEVYITAKELLWSSLSKESSLESEVDAMLSSVISLERVYISSREYLEQTLSSAERTVIDTVKIREELTHNIYSYMESHKIELNSELEEGVSELVTRIEKEYIRGITFQFISYLAIYQSSFRNYMKMILIVTISVILVLSVILILLSRYKHRGVRTITYSMIGSSLLIIIGSGLLLITKQHTKYQVTPYYYNRFIESYLKQSIITVLVIGIFYIGISLAGIILTSYMKKRRGNK